MSSRKGFLVVAVLFAHLWFGDAILASSSSTNGTTPDQQQRHSQHHRQHHHRHHHHKHTVNFSAPASGKRSRAGDSNLKIHRSSLLEHKTARKRLARVRSSSSSSSSSSSALTCSHSAFMNCLNLGNPFELSDLIASVGTTDLISYSSAKFAPADSKMLKSRLSAVCAATEPIVNCLARASCLGDGTNSDAPIWKSVFVGALPQQARLLPNWVKSLRYLPAACDILLGRNRTSSSSSSLSKTSLQPQLTFDFRSIEKCPGLSSDLFKEECGGMEAEDDDVDDVAVIEQDPWKLPSSSLSSTTLQWVDFTFLELLKADELTGQVNFSAMPYVSETACVYLNRKIDCFTVQVYRYCEASIQDPIISAMLKFINFQLLISDSSHRCKLLSEDASEMRRVLAMTVNTKDLKSLSFVNSLDVMDTESNNSVQGSSTDDSVSTTDTPIDYGGGMTLSEDKFSVIQTSSSSSSSSAIMSCFSHVVYYVHFIVAFALILLS